MYTCTYRIIYDLQIDRHADLLRAILEPRCKLTSLLLLRHQHARVHPLGHAPSAQWRLFLASRKYGDGSKWYWLGKGWRRTVNVTGRAEGEPQHRECHDDGVANTSAPFHLLGTHVD